MKMCEKKERNIKRKEKINTRDNQTEPKKDQEDCHSETLLTLPIYTLIYQTHALRQRRRRIYIREKEKGAGVREHSECENTGLPFN